MMNGTIKKNIKEILLYLFFSFCTTAITIETYFFLTRVVSWGFYTSNIFSWVIAGSFAFYTNKKAVYNDKGKTFPKAVIFFLSRIVTLGLETLLLYAGIEKLGIDDVAVKLIVQVVVIVENYLMGKLLVFRNQNSQKELIPKDNPLKRKGGEDSGNL